MQWIDSFCCEKLFGVITMVLNVIPGVELGVSAAVAAVAALGAVGSAGRT